MQRPGTASFPVFVVELTQVITGEGGIAGANFIGAGSGVDDLVLISSAMIHDIGIKTGIALFVRLVGVPTFCNCLRIVGSISVSIIAHKLIFIYLFLDGLQAGATTIGRWN